MGVVMPMGVVHPLILAGTMPAPGFFALGMGALAPVGALMAHLLYGIVLGAVYGRPAEISQPSPRRAAA